MRLFVCFCFRAKRTNVAADQSGLKRLKELKLGTVLSCQLPPVRAEGSKNAPGMPRGLRGTWVDVYVIRGHCIILCTDCDDLMGQIFYLLRLLGIVLTASLSTEERHESNQF